MTAFFDDILLEAEYAEAINVGNEGFKFLQHFRVVFGKRDNVCFIVIHTVEDKLVYGIAHFPKGKTLPVKLKYISVVNLPDFLLSFAKLAFCDVKHVDFSRETVFFTVNTYAGEDTLFCGVSSAVNLFVGVGTVYLILILKSHSAAITV